MKEAVISRLKMIEQSHGGVLRPSDVVKDAKNPDSPLHDLFDWDLERSAERHWMERARQIITSVKVIIKHDNTSVNAVYYVRDPSIPADRQGYVAITSVSQDKDKAREIAAREFASAMVSLHRAKTVAMALGISPELDDVLITLQTLKAKAIA
jgi:flagellar basal body rod protein FlgC